MMWKEIQIKLLTKTQKQYIENLEDMIMTS